MIPAILPALNQQVSDSGLTVAAMPDALGRSAPDYRLRRPQCRRRSAPASSLNCGPSLELAAHWNHRGIARSTAIATFNRHTESPTPDLGECDIPRPIPQRNGEYAMTVRYDDPNIEQWWEGRVAYVRHQTQALRDAGWTYPQAVDRHHEFGADDFTWLLRLVLQVQPARRR